MHISLRFLIITRDTTLHYTFTDRFAHTRISDTNSHNNAPEAYTTPTFSHQPTPTQHYFLSRRLKQTPRRSKMRFRGENE
jgi:hypothetical protein